jgi:hypothetical protein
MSENEKKETSKRAEILGLHIQRKNHGSER